MIKVKIHDETTWKPPICSVCKQPVSVVYFVKESGTFCHQCEGKARKARRKRKKKKL